MTRRLAFDLLERAVWTFLQAFLAVWTIGAWTDLGDGSLAQRAATAGIAAVLALLKGVAASRLGDRTAATLPPDRS